MTDGALLAWIERGQLISALLVAIGVAGEFILAFAAGAPTRRIEAARHIETLQLQEKLASSQLALAQLQELNTQRKIDAAAKAAIIDALKFSGAPEGPIAISYLSGSVREPSEFAFILADVIREAGWDVPKPTGGFMFGVPPRGLAIRIGPGDVPLRATVLADALQRGGLAVVTGRPKDIPPGDVTLFVGLKP